jgi:protein tyrosine phosphatase
MFSSINLLNGVFESSLKIMFWLYFSAGIGRTGTYIALDSIINEGETEGAVDIYSCVRNIREQRVNMIETIVSYSNLLCIIVSGFVLT